MLQLSANVSISIFFCLDKGFHDFFLQFLQILGDDFELPINVDVINCEEEPCEVVRGTDVITNMTFVACK